MRLLVSVRGPAEARAARRGGADVIDAKDPAHGALGPVGPARLAAICRAVGAGRPVSAALGDGADEAGVLGRATAAARLGMAFVKVGFAGVPSERWAARLARAVRHTVGAGTEVVLVAYADWQSVDGPPPAQILAVAHGGGAAGVLLDTARKAAPLFALASPDTVAAWVAAAHAGGLFAALAGSLAGADFATARALGAEVVGVRGAACVGGRTGRVSAARVARLKAFLTGGRRGNAVGVLS